MADEPQTDNPDYLWPRVSLSTADLSVLTGSMIAAQEYLEAVVRVARAEGRSGPARQLGQLRLARDTVIAYTHGFAGSLRECSCPLPLTMAGCPIHPRSWDDSGG